MLSLQQMLEVSEYTVFFTGAGISTESGIPDFRSPGGFWTQHKPITFQNFIDSKEARRKSWRRKFEMELMMKNASPNLGHMAISKLVKNGDVKLVITQNVDGLHQLSGIPENKIVELHGNTTHARCLTCHKHYSLSFIRHEFMSNNEPPTCSSCGGLIKTATISFGQPMPENEMDRAEAGTKASDLFIVVGSSLVVYPAAGFPASAQRRGAKLIIINRESTELDHTADLVVNAEIGPTLSALTDALLEGNAN
jgi:NAD-dependent deacetylase